MIYTSNDNTYLHLPGITVAENAAGERRFLLPDGLGSVRQATGESGAVVVYNEFDPYGNLILHSSFLISNYGYTGEWWEEEVGLLYLRARWYRPETGSFLSRDPVEGEPPFLYVRGNPVTLADPSGQDPCTDDDPFTICHTPPIGGGSPTFPPTPISTAPQPIPPIPVPDSRCTGAPYVECVPPPPPNRPTIGPLNSCDLEMFSALGYAEGGTQSIAIGFNLAEIWGEEVVYDFATMERAIFTFEDIPMFPDLGIPPSAGYTTAALDYTASPYYVDLFYFESWKDINQEYSGPFDGVTSGVSAGVGIGSVYVWSSEMIGLGGYESYSFGVSPIPIWTVSWFATEYTMEMESRHQYKSADGNVHKDAMQLMKTDLSSGTYRRYNAVIIYGIGRYSAAIDLERTWKEHRLFFEYHFADFWENRTGG